MFDARLIKQFHLLVPLSLTLIIALVSLPAFADDTPTVQAEEIEVNSSSVEKDSSTLWKETKQKTGEAASSAAAFSKVQGGKILEASKTGVAKGANAVSTGSVKAWDATKKATKSAVQFTGEKAAQAGTVIADVVKGDDSKAPVSDKSIGE